MGISVILSVWRGQQYLRECLESIINQRAFVNNEIEYEILLAVDGCSVVRRWLEQHKFPKVKIYWIHKNVGNYIAYNSLIDIAKYDFITIFGADDIMLPNFIDYDCMMSEHYDIVGHCYNVLSESSQVIKPTKGVIRAAGVLGVRKSVYDAIGGFSPWRCAADTEFQKRACRAGYTIKHLPEVVFTRRVHEESVTQLRETNWKSNLRQQYIQEIERMKNENITRIETLRMTLTPFEELENEI